MRRVRGPRSGITWDEQVVHLARHALTIVEEERRPCCACESAPGALPDEPVFCDECTAPVPFEELGTGD